MKLPALAAFIVTFALSQAYAQPTQQACSTPPPATLQNCSSQGPGGVPSAIQCLQDNICFLDAKIKSLTQTKPPPSLTCKEGVAQARGRTFVDVGFTPTVVTIEMGATPPAAWEIAVGGFYIIVAPETVGSANYKACH